MHGLSIRTKLIIAFTVVVLFSSGSLGYLNNRSTHKALTEAANEFLLSAASRTAARLDHFISSNLESISAESRQTVLGTYLKYNVDNPRDESLDERLIGILNTFRERDDVFISSYALLDMKGRNILDTHTSNIGQDESDRSYFSTPLGIAFGRRPYISPVEFEKNGDASIYISNRVVDLEGKIIGVLRARYSASILQYLLIQDIGLAGSQSFPMLLDEHHIRLAYGRMTGRAVGQVIYKSIVPFDSAYISELQLKRRLPKRPPNELSTNIPAFEVSLGKGLSSSKPYFKTLLAIAGNQLMAAAVAKMNTQPWLVVFVKPQDIFLAPVKAQTQNTLLLSLVIALMVAGLAVFLAHVLAHPINRLTAAAIQVAEGDLTARIRTTSHDEIGALASAFNSMTDQLSELIGSLEQQIAERKQAEQALSESEERLRLTLGATQIGIFDWDVEHDIWIASNEYYTMLGYLPKDGTADREEWLARVHPDDRTLIEAKLRAVLAGEPAVDPSLAYEYEARIRHANGPYRWVHVKGFGVKHDPEGRISRMLGIRMDIDERKTAEEALCRLNTELDQRVLARTAQLEAANQELEEFVYSISHDLRAPLRHIDGFTELLRQKAGTNFDEQSRHYMDTISESARKMGLLIDDLLSFSHMGRHTMSFQPVDLEKLLRDIMRELEPDAVGRNIDWCIGDLPVVSGDADMLRMVLVNLISNAFKFTRPRQQAQIEIGSLPGQGREVVIFVRDNGVGFDMNYADKLFNVFQRLHRVEEFEGTGIGLANVHRIITRHGGRTWAEGKIDQGATFFFSLPST